MKLKQIFCNHIWKDTNKTYLRSYKVYDKWTNDYCYDTKEFAFNQVCLKCDKTRMIVKEEIKL